MAPEHTPSSTQSQENHVLREEDYQQIQKEKDELDEAIEKAKRQIQRNVAWLQVLKKRQAILAPPEMELHAQEHIQEIGAPWSGHDLRRE